MSSNVENLFYHLWNDASHMAKPVYPGMIMVLIVCLTFLAGCSDPLQRDTSEGNVQPSAVWTTVPTTVTSVRTTTVVTALPTTVVTALPTTVKPTPLPTLTAQQAQEAVQTTLDLITNMAVITDSQGNKIGWPTLPNGVPCPTDGQAGPAQLTTLQGYPLYEVPVLSNGERVGEFYVNLTRSADGGVQFVEGSSSSPSGIPVRSY